MSVVEEGGREGSRRKSHLSCGDEKYRAICVPFTHTRPGHILALKQNSLLNLEAPPVASDVPSGLSTFSRLKFLFIQ